MQSQTQKVTWIGKSVEIKEKLPEAPKATRKCPKCNSPFFSRVNVETWFDAGANVLIYCCNCRDPWIAYESTELEVE